MILDDDMSESSLANFYFLERQQYSLFILPIVTRQCNFRCVYCYEKFSNNKMSKETYDNLLSATEDLIDKKGYKILHISYFGGEPLLEYKEICEFSEKLSKLTAQKNIDFICGMTTNGYLLTKDRLHNLVKQNVKEYQITVDGLKQTHDNSRFLVNKSGTWDVIMKNLLDAKDSDLDFKILIRTNFDNEVKEKTHEYLEFMSKHFKDDPRFGFHFEGVKKLGGDDDNELDIVESEAAGINIMTATAKSLGLNVSGAETFVRPFGLVCYASKNDSFAIDTDGTVMKCTVHLDSPKNKIGSISNGKFQIKDHMMSEWTSCSLPEKCESCKILSICYNKKCPAARYPLNPCDKFIEIYEETLKAFYLS